MNGNEQVSTTDVVRAKWPVDEVVMPDNILPLFKKNKCFAKRTKVSQGSIVFVGIYHTLSEPWNHPCAQWCTVSPPLSLFGLKRMIGALKSENSQRLHVQ